MRPGFRIAYYFAISIFTAVLFVALIEDTEVHRFDPLSLLPAIVACTDYYGTLVVASLIKQRNPAADLGRFELNPLFKKDIAHLRIFSFGFFLQVCMRLAVFVMLSHAPAGHWNQVFLGGVGFTLGLNGALTIHHLINIFYIRHIFPTHRFESSVHWRHGRTPGMDTSIIADGICLAVFIVSALFVPNALVVGGLLGLVACRLMRIRLTKEAALGLHS
jgi:hypothetical protein